MNRSKLFSVFLVICLVLSAFAVMKALSFLSPQDSDPDRKIVFDVPPGSNYSSLLPRLLEDRIIEDGFAFKVFVKLNAVAKPLKVGEYELYFHMPPAEILNVLSSGRSIERLVTIPEGSNIVDVAAVLERSGFGTKAAILKSLTDKKLVQKLLGETYPSFEGYLFPETYAFNKYSTLETVIKNMVDMFLKVYGDVSKLKQNDWSRNQVVTLASIIEKETGAPEERPLISSVFHNRLLKKMKLQTDPTIMYSIFLTSGTFPFNIHKEDILRAHPYNTYSVYGLPPGPIANPGREALAAALQPASSSYLYFVSKNNGTHTFSESLELHNSAVQTYQINSKARAGKSWRDLKKKDAPKKTEASKVRKK